MIFLRGVFICRLSIFFLVFFLITSCKDDDDNVNIENEIICCSEEITFSSESYVLLDTRFDTLLITENIDGKPIALFLLNDPDTSDIENISRTFLLTGQTEGVTFRISLNVNVSDNDSCIPLGVYSIDSATLSEGILVFEYEINSLGVIYTHRPINSSGSLEITKCDYESKLISGRFDVKGLRAYINPTTFDFAGLEIKDGLFENVCLEIE